MSFKVEVQADNSGSWAGNGLRFATHADAEIYAVDLKARWTLVRDYQVIEVDAPATHEVRLQPFQVVRLDADD